MNKKNKALTIGGATEDIFIMYSDGKSMIFHEEDKKHSFILLSEGEKIEVKNVVYSTGGGATNSAASFSRLDFNATSFFQLGNDRQGAFVMENLQKYALNLEYIAQTDDYMTGVSFIIPSREHDRTVLAYRGANGQMKKSSIPFDIIPDADLLYITSLSGDSSHNLVPIVQKAKEHNIFVANNPGSSQLAAGAELLQDALPYIDIFILNKQEASELMLSLSKSKMDLLEEQPSEKEAREEMPNLLEPIFYQDICFNLHDYFKEILQRGPKIVVVTNGAEGVYVAHENTIYFHPSIKTDIENTLGAGDSFGSCFAANIFNGDSIEDALIKGIINASSVISYLDAKTGLLTPQELNSRLHSTAVQTQTFAL